MEEQVKAAIEMLFDRVEFCELLSKVLFSIVILIFAVSGILEWLQVRKLKERIKSLEEAVSRAE